MTKAQFDEITKHIKANISEHYNLGLHLDNGITLVGQAELLGTKTILLTTATKQKQYVDLDRIVFLSVI